MTGFGHRLRQERMRLKLSQSALGGVGGVETNAQGNYESGARSPKADYLLRVAERGVDITYVLTGVRHEATQPLPAANLDLPQEGQGAAGEAHMSKVTDQLHRNLHGLIDALYQMARMIEARANCTDDATTKGELDIIRAQTHALAEASVRLIFVTSKLS